MYCLCLYCVLCTVYVSVWIRGCACLCVPAFLFRRSRHWSIRPHPGLGYRSCHHATFALVPPSHPIVTHPNSAFFSLDRVKCQNEKRRRELENAYISELANLISTTDMAQNGKKDKCVILQETVNQVGWRRWVGWTWINGVGFKL